MAGDVTIKVIAQDGSIQVFKKIGVEAGHMGDSVKSSAARWSRGGCRPEGDSSIIR